MADSNATSTVEAEYELFNRELRLDGGEPKVESTTTAEPEKSTEKSTEKSEGDVSSSEKENPSEVEKQPEEKMDEGKSGEEKEATEESEKPEEVPEEEEEEEEEVEEVIEDAEDVWDGEDPNDVEVEQFCQPSETSILEDMAEHSRKKKLLVYPVKMSELGHPSILECINSCAEFKTTYVQSKQGSAEGSVGWTGIIELLFKSAFAANEAIETLKAIREDVTVRLMELGENTKKMVDQWIVETTMQTPRTIGHLMVVKRLPETVTLTELKDIFKESRDIILPKPRLGKRLAYIFFETEEKMKECHEKFTAERPVIGDVKLKVLLYQPPEVPQGLLRMKRRYRILLQIEQLKKSLKDKKAKHSPQTIKKIESTIENCTSLIERDDKAREKVNLPLLTLRELKSIKPVRESVQADTIWLPGVSGGPGRRDSFMEFDHDDDEHGSNDRHGSRWPSNKRWERERDHRPMSRPGNTSGVPSLLDMSMNMGPNFNPVARVQEIAAKIAQMACNIPRGGGGGGSGMRGGRGGSSGPGGFGQGGRGGGGGRGFGDFQHRDSGFHGGKGSSMGGGRGGSGGGGSGSYGNRSSFNNNKRSRSPPKSRDDDSSSNAGDGKSDTFEPAGKVAKQDGDKSSQWGNKRFGSGGGSGGGGMGNFSRNNDYNKGGMGGNQRGGGTSQRGGGGNQRGGGNFQSGSNQKGGFNQGGFNQGTGAAAANQGTAGAYNQGAGTYNQGNQAQQATGAYNQAQGTYNQAANQTGAQGTTGYNQAATATYNQAGAYNQAGYNQGYNQAGYNQAYPGYNAAGGYNYDYNQYNQAGYNMQAAGYGYNYPVGYPAQGQQATQQQGQQWTAGTTATTGQQQTAQQPAATQSTDWSQQGQQQQTAWPSAMPQTTADASAAGGTANQNTAAYGYNWNAAATTWPAK